MVLSTTSKLHMHIAYFSFNFSNFNFALLLHYYCMFSPCSFYIMFSRLFPDCVAAVARTHKVLVIYLLFYSSFNHFITNGIIIIQLAISLPRTVAHIHCELIVFMHMLSPINVKNLIDLLRSVRVMTDDLH